jgi:hypothetical protein
VRPLLRRVQGRQTGSEDVVAIPCGSTRNPAARPAPTRLGCCECSDALKGGTEPQTHWEKAVSVHDHDTRVHRERDARDRSGASGSGWGQTIKGMISLERAEFGHGVPVASIVSFGSTAVGWLRWMRGRRVQTRNLA